MLLFVIQTDRKTNRINHITQFIESGINGLIIVPSFLSSSAIDVFKQLEEKKIPFIFCNRMVPGIEVPFVTSNSFFGGYLATRHLIDTGHKNIAFISLPLYQISYERFSGYRAALEEAGIEERNEFLVFEKNYFGSDLGYEGTKKLLSIKERPDAIFCMNDRIARGAYDAISEAGLKVGKEIAVMGYNDTEICDMLPVKLSSVKFRQYEIGQRAAQILLQIIQMKMSDDFTVKLFQPEIVVRDSTGSLNNIDR